MSDDLVKRLRTEPNWMREDYPQSEAADRIEAQAARIAKLEALLQEAAVELHTYIDAEYPSRLFYADEKRKHNRDMEIVFRIQSALKGGKDDQG